MSGYVRSSRQEDSATSSPSAHVYRPQGQERTAFGSSLGVPAHVHPGAHDPFLSPAGMSMVRRERKEGLGPGSHLDRTRVAIPIAENLAEGNGLYCKGGRNSNRSVYGEGTGRLGEAVGFNPRAVHGRTRGRATERRGTVGAGIGWSNRWDGSDAGSIIPRFSPERGDSASPAPRGRSVRRGASRQRGSMMQGGGSSPAAAFRSGDTTGAESNESSNPGVDSGSRAIHGVDVADAASPGPPVGLHVSPGLSQAPVSAGRGRVGREGGDLSEGLTFDVGARANDGGIVSIVPYRRASNDERLTDSNGGDWEHATGARADARRGGKGALHDAAADAANGHTAGRRGGRRGISVAEAVSRAQRLGPRVRRQQDENVAADSKPEEIATVISAGAVSRAGVQRTQFPEDVSRRLDTGLASSEGRIESTNAAPLGGVGVAVHGT